MDTKNVKYFKTVYEEKSINTAAKKLFISPQGLGKIIRSMEAEFNTTFFIRTKQGIKPTENGTIFYKQCKKISKEMDTLSDLLQETKGHKPTVRICFANGVLKVISLDRVFELVHKQKDFHVEWCEYENAVVLQKVLQSEIDYGLVIGKTAQPEFHQRLLYSIPVSIYVYEGHPFYNEECITLDMLKNENIIIMNEQYRIYHDFLHACQVEGFVPKIKAKTMDGGTLYMWVAQKIGIAISPTLPMLPYPNVKAIPFQSNYSWDIYSVYLKEQVNLPLVQQIDNYWGGRE